MTPPIHVPRDGAADQYAATFTGFDSAWTDKPKQPGAIASILHDTEGRLTLCAPILASFDQARTRIAELSAQCKLHIVAIDQPTIVKNSVGMRPVEYVVSSPVGSWGGGVQPSYTGKKGMFCRASPIWPFLNSLKSELGFRENPVAAIGQSTGRFLMEVFPVLSIPALFPGAMNNSKLPKYNPKNKKKFRMKDWNNLLHALRAGNCCDDYVDLDPWLADAQQDEAPSKAAQDRLDAVICALQAYTWWRDGLRRSAMIGDLISGYMVATVDGACRDRLARQIGKVLRERGHKVSLTTLAT